MKWKPPITSDSTPNKVLNSSTVSKREKNNKTNQTPYVVQRLTIFKYNIHSVYTFSDGTHQELIIVLLLIQSEQILNMSSAEKVTL